MNGKDKTLESDRERFEKNLAALMKVPKNEIEALESKRQKKSRERRKS